MTLDELARRMTRAEFQRWQVFDTLEPIGFLRDDYLAAHAARMAAWPHVTKLPPVEEFLLFRPDRFEEVPDDGEEIDLAGWVRSAEKRGLPVVRCDDPDG